MQKITKEQAIDLADSKFWEGMTSKEIAQFQMNTPNLCMPFGIFHKALEEALGRPVWTHELGMHADDIRKELNGEKCAPTFDEIISLIPEKKRLIVIEA